MYEIGDKVIYQGADKSAYKRRGVVASIEEKNGKPQLTVAFGDGEEFTAPIDDWSRAFTNAASVRTTNATVRNALNARTAKNAADYNDPKVRQAYIDGCKEDFDYAVQLMKDRTENAAKALERETKTGDGVVFSDRTLNDLESAFSRTKYPEIGKMIADLKSIFKNQRGKFAKAAQILRQ